MSTACERRVIKLPCGHEEELDVRCTAGSDPSKLNHFLFLSRSSSSSTDLVNQQKQVTAITLPWLRRINNRLVVYVTHLHHWVESMIGVTFKPSVPITCLPRVHSTKCIEEEWVTAQTVILMIIMMVILHKLLTAGKSLAPLLMGISTMTTLARTPLPL